MRTEQHRHHPEATPTLLTGWGRTAPSAARLFRPGTADQVVDLLAPPPNDGVPERGVLARGLGRSYGDAAQVAGGLAVSTERLTEVDLDPATGVLVAGAGCSLDDGSRGSCRRGGSCR